MMKLVVGMVLWFGYIAQPTVNSCKNKLVEGINTILLHIYYQSSLDSIQIKNRTAPQIEKLVTL